MKRCARLRRRTPISPLPGPFSTVDAYIPARGTPSIAARAISTVDVAQPARIPFSIITGGCTILGTRICWFEVWICCGGTTMMAPNPWNSHSPLLVFIAVAYMPPPMYPWRPITCRSSGAAMVTHPLGWQLANFRIRGGACPPYSHSLTFLRCKNSDVCLPVNLSPSDYWNVC